MRLIAIGLAVCAAVACNAPTAGGSGDIEPWATRAEEWQQSRAVIAAENSIHVMRFYAPGARFADHTWISWFDQDAPLPSYAFLARRAGPPRVRGLYLSTDGLVLDYRYTEAGVTATFLEANQVGSRGITESVLTEPERGPRHILDPDHDRVEQLTTVAHLHVDYWTGEDVASPYATDAVVSDSLLGIHSADPMDRGVAARLGLPSSTIVEDADSENLAIFTALAIHEGESTDDVYVLLSTNDGSGCPGALAVALKTRDRLIIRETRYHELSAARRCISDQMLPRGWWNEIAIPKSADPLLTAVITRSNGDIAFPIFDGTTEMVELLGWAIDRFPAAGLAMPDVHSVTFVEGCEGGRIGHATGGSDITICENPRFIDEADIAFKRLVLHELGHVWIDLHVSDEARSRFMSHVGLSEWSDRSVPWHERGVEQAANALMYGLMDEVETFDMIDAPYDEAQMCRERAENFKALTGNDAIAPCQLATNP